MTMVKTRVFLDTVPQGELFKISMGEGEASSTIPAALAVEGHRVVGVEHADGTFVVTFRKGIG